MKLMPGYVVEIRGEGKWRVVCETDDKIEVITYPWAASWAAPRTFDRSQVETVIPLVGKHAQPRPSIPPSEQHKADLCALADAGKITPDEAMRHLKSPVFPRFEKWCQIHYGIFAYLTFLVGVIAGGLFVLAL